MEFMLEVILFTAAGCGLGIVTGMIPGVHINLIATLVLASLPVFRGFDLFCVAAMIMAMSVTHTFLDFIPSVLFGAPDSDTALAVLPGHKMLLDGRALEAIKLSGAGSLIALLVACGAFAGLVRWVPALYSAIRPNIHYLLVFMVLMSLAGEKNSLKAIGVFAASGIFGMLVLSAGFEGGMIFPALSGMFGVSTLLLSLGKAGALPLQAKANMTLGKWRILKSSLVGAVSGMLVGLLPGIGPSQAAYVAQQGMRKRGVKDFLVTVSGINTANIIFTLVVLYTLGKMRSGIVIAIDEVLGEMGVEHLKMFLGIILLAGGAALFIHMGLGGFLVKKMSGKSGRVYQYISVGIILFVVGCVFVMTKWVGFLVLVVGTAIGLLPPLCGVRRAECMGFLLLPVILFYFGVKGQLLGLMGVVG